ncbi:hypothetical protein OF83DRAFT_1172085 [Amylostereum chailletii]|nr:hypothetical protein OF83DRAFT_1172085 [Amylostereum chailletii]
MPPPASDRWHVPDLVLDQAAVFVKFQFTLTGVSLWDCVSNLAFDWRILTCRRIRTWSTWIYLSCRLNLLLAIVLMLVNLSVPPSSINCQTWGVFAFLFFYIAAICSSILIALRAIAVCMKNKFVVAFVVFGRLVQIATLVRYAVALKSKVSVPPIPVACVTAISHRLTFGVYAFFSLDVATLSLILAWLWRHSEPRTVRPAFLQMLWQQGLIWLFVELAGELPSLVAITVTKDDFSNATFQSAGMIFIALCTTHFFQALFTFEQRITDTMNCSHILSTSEFPIGMSRGETVSTVVDDDNDGVSLSPTAEKHGQ